MTEKLKSLFYLILIILVIYNIYTGATIQEIGIPGMFSIKFGESTTDKESSAPDENNYSGELAPKYLMDNNPGRVIITSYLGGNSYRLEEPSSPWPWESTATLVNGNLTGDAKILTSLATFRIEGTTRNDGSIVIEYIFITEGDGSPTNGRVDNHIWYPTK